MRIILFTILFYGFYIIEVNAEEYKGYGEYHFGPNVTETKACALALENAKKSVLSKVYAENIFSEDLMRCSETDGDGQCELNKSTISIINGSIKEMKSMEKTLKRLEGYSICRLDIVAKIVKPEQKKDPNFDFSIKINKKYFRDKEKFMIEIEPSIKMFVNIFQWDPYGSEGIHLTKIFPNEYESNNEIKNKKIIPGKKHNYSFKVEYPYKTQDKKYVDEYLVIVSTKNNINFVTEFDFKSFQERISEIPNDEYRTKKISYEILKN